MMQDEVSETENIRKNLSIERMIVQGCDILLDVNQTFVRQGITDLSRHHASPILNKLQDKKLSYRLETGRQQRISL